MKYLLLVIAIIYHLLLLACIAMLVIICGATDWEMGEGFIFLISLAGIIIFLPPAIWATILYRKWPVEHGSFQVVILGGIILSLALGIVYFFAG